MSDVDVDVVVDLPMIEAAVVIEYGGPQGPPGPPGPTPTWWAGTQAQFNAIPLKDASTLYVITDMDA